jgi:hypothetical protein
VAVHGCEEGDSGLLRLVMQAAEVTDLASVGDGGRCGGSKGRHAGGMRQRTEQPADSISTTQAVLPSGVAARFGWGLLNLWAGGWGLRWCARVLNPSRALPSPATGSSSGPQVASSLVFVGDLQSGGHFWSYAGRSGSAFEGGAELGTSAMSVSLRLGCEDLCGSDDGPHGGGGSVGHRPLWIVTW